jgi:hypothetical protein
MTSYVIASLKRSNPHLNGGNLSMRFTLLAGDCLITLGLGTPSNRIRGYSTSGCSE